jgi:NAD(P)-dependent dehydrogenase (short-subunit alcohol dehydrogenase family)
MMARIALVTGGGSGIGRTACLALSSAGFVIALIGRRAEPLEKVAQEIRATGSEALPLTCDVADEAQVAKVFATIRKTYGRLDLLFNNAGLFSPPGLLEDVDVAAWKAVVDVNLNGAYYCTQHAFRIMKEQKPQGGRIINNGSISATAPRPNSAAYTATKHAITGLTKSAALDGRKYDIAVSQIDIGNAETEMTGRMKAGVPQANGTIAPEPLMDLKHVGDALIYMAGLPLEANVQFMTVMATKMPFVGRG